jgi:hypothetical protein
MTDIGAAAPSPTPCTCTAYRAVPRYRALPSYRVHHTALNRQASHGLCVHMVQQLAGCIVALRCPAHTPAQAAEPCTERVTCGWLVPPAPPQSPEGRLGPGSAPRGTQTSSAGTHISHTHTHTQQRMPSQALGRLLPWTAAPQLLPHLLLLMLPGFVLQLQAPLASTVIQMQRVSWLRPPCSLTQDNHACQPIQPAACKVDTHTKHLATVLHFCRGDNTTPCHQTPADPVPSAAAYIHVQSRVWPNNQPGTAYNHPYWGPGSTAIMEGYEHNSMAPANWGRPSPLTRAVLWSRESHGERLQLLALPPSPLLNTCRTPCGLHMHLVGAVTSIPGCTARAP